MRLYLNETSPFARMVLATACELGMDGLELTWVDPWRSPAELIALNPFCTVPTLHLDDGTVLYESLLICEHLIALDRTGETRVIYADAADAPALKRLAIGKTLMETAFRKAILRRCNGVSPDNELEQRAAAALARILTELEAAPLPERGRQDGRVALADLCLAVALEYLRFRLEKDCSGHIGSRLRSWLAVMGARTSLRCTTPGRLERHPASLAQLLPPFKSD